jgi:hypothetical protein
MQRIRTRRAPLGLQRLTKTAKSPSGLRLRQQKQPSVCGLTSQSRPDSGHFAFFQSIKYPKWSNWIMVRLKRISLSESGDPLFFQEVGSWSKFAGNGSQIASSPRWSPRAVQPGREIPDLVFPVSWHHDAEIWFFLCHWPIRIYHDSPATDDNRKDGMGWSIHGCYRRGLIFSCFNATRTRWFAALMTRNRSLHEMILGACVLTLWTTM